MIILNKLNLRTFSKLTMYELEDYTSFISIISENIYEIKVYECFNEHYETFKEEMLHMPVIEFVFLSEFFPDYPELITLGSLINHGHDERLLLYSFDDIRKQV
ncbi:hypothetical protein NBO_24g0023 [Nosema bombycis CQ1]|uniref:Uncharacterized protein n=1 Tax=Nosema bombycis (strain CQ1 / CVCC 102059) TaxID=578461 RepID=R0MNY0_NOSB1|nr:hypothetical protein NBO_24g0023 [Nosema bombycis CQ1]|eukprot:EOB14578.1 hypothetical protein NBO_24g0023 [Nosema bombycis CQ1]